MIRPFTLICAALAAGSGLYLYQAKQRTLLLDQRIDQVQHQIEGMRAHIGLLHADYADLARPDRVAALAARYLTLRPTAPDQFVEGATLTARLPKIGHPDQPDPGQPILNPANPVPSNPPPALLLAATTLAPAADRADGTRLLPAITTLPAIRPAATAPAIPARIAARTRPAPARPRPATRLAAIQPDPGPANPSRARSSRAPLYPPDRAQPPLTQPPLTLARASGSMLGGADSAAMPAPRPVAN